VFYLLSIDNGARCDRMRENMRTDEEEEKK